MTSAAPTNQTGRRFALLLNAYTRSESEHRTTSHDSHRNLLNAYQAKLGLWRKSQESSASDFNLLDTLKISREEIKHSIMVEWLLDHRIERCGTHAQGKLGFRLFLNETGLSKTYAETDYFVSREVKGSNSRVDLEIAAPGHFIIHIENKICSDEATDHENKEDQTEREWSDLQRRARHLATRSKHVHAFFVTLLGQKPSCNHFTPLPWHRLADVLDRFAKRAKAPEVSLFATHYARALRRMTQQETRYEEDEETENSPQP